jgi:hypothetical protein
MPIIILKLPGPAIISRDSIHTAKVVAIEPWKGES